MIGKTLAHYRILDQLGEGGMGVVYRAEDTKLGREVAIKVLPADRIENDDRFHRFEREALMLAALNHPNIVNLYSIEEAEGIRFLTMALIEGHCLSEVIPQEGMPLDRFFDVAIPLADALAAAHDKGIIHRDLKPGNIMLTKEGRVMVLDFGLAKLRQVGADELDTQIGTEVLTQQGQILGTVAYMSPEQAQGKPLDERSDIFSLGIILHEMATGNRPFIGDNQISILSSIVKDIPTTVTQMRPALPRHLGRIVRHTLEKEPELRFQAALDLRNELRDLQREIESEQIIARAKKGTDRPTRLQQKGLLVATATILALLLITVGLNVGGGRDRVQQEGVQIEPVSAATPSVAVLPFENLSPDPENEYFSRGMTEELVSKLSRIQSFRVRSTPLEWVRDDQQRIEDIGKELGVRYLLEGSVRKAGDKVRITAQLIDTSSAFHLWSRDFDGELEDIFAVQEETALQIAKALDVELTAAEDETVRNRYTEITDAYDAYLRGWALIESFHIHADGAKERLQAAKKHFARALELDGDYPLALAGLAMVESYTHYLGVDTSPVRIQQTEELAGRALKLEPGLPEALVALGQVSWLRGDYVESANHLRQALLRDPDNGYVWCELAAACNMQDPPEAEQAEAAARKAIRFQPGYTFGHAQLGWALESQGRFHEAITAFRHSVELNTEFRPGYLGLGDSHLAVGDYSEALSNYEKAHQLRESAALSVDIGAIHAALGDVEASLTMLEMALANGYDDFAAVTTNPRFAPLRDDPRFQDLIQRYEEGGG